MDLRKVIKFGKATYSMTLPKEWIVEHNVDKGDLLKVEKRPRGRLEVSLNDTENEIEVKKVDISAEGKDSTDIFREVIAAYIKNYTVITIKGDLKGKMKELREKLQELIGLEVMEVSTSEIVAKSFLDVTETNVQQILKRVFYIIKSMSDEFKTCVKACTDIDEVMQMDREVNRNTLFMIKYLFKALENPDVAHESGMKNFEIFFTWELVKYMENIADKIKMMADIASNKEILVKTDATSEFLEVYRKVEDNFYFAMGEYFKKSKENIHEIFKKVKENEEMCNDFLSDYKKAWTPLLIDHMKDINMFTRGIVEIIVDLE